MTVVQDELHSLAANTRSVVLQTATEEQKQAYNTGAANDTLTDQMKNQFAQRANEEYVTKLGMTSAVVKPLIEETAAAF